MSHVRFDVVKKNATIPDTLSLIVKAVNICSRSPFVERLTAQLNYTGDKYAFVKKVFDFVCNNVPYVLDQPGDEEVWTPELTMKEGRGDCKKMTVLIASILKCAGIEPVLKHVYYKHSTNTHIYVIVPNPDLNNYLTVDPVNHKMWNTEVTGIRSASLHFLNGKTMDLHMMGAPPENRIKANFSRSGFPSACRGLDDDIAFVAGVASMGAAAEVWANALTADFGITGLDEDEIMGTAYEIDGMGKRRRKIFRKKTAAQKKAGKEKRKARRKKLFGFFKKGTLAPSRAAFLLIVRSNVFKLANRMAKVWIKDSGKLKRMWKEFGGNPNKLMQAIKAGAKRKDPALASKVNGIAGMGAPISVATLEAMEMAGTMGYVEGIGSAAAIAAAIAAATPIIVAVIKIVGKSKDDQDTSVDDAGEAVQQSAEAVQENYSTEGIGYMSDQDDIVEGIGATDELSSDMYIDGMGRIRRKNKKKRKVKKVRKGKARRQARRARKGKGKDGDGGSEEGEEREERESITSKIRASIPKIHDEDVKTLSVLAEYGANKILKGQVSQEDVKQFGNQDGGTENTPLAKPDKDEDDEVAVPGGSRRIPVGPVSRATVNRQTPALSTPELSTPAAGSFGLSEINSIPTLLVWLKGSLVITLTDNPILSSVIIVGSFLFLTRKSIFNFFTLKK